MSCRPPLAFRPLVFLFRPQGGDIADFEKHWYSAMVGLGTITVYAGPDLDNNRP